MKPYYEHAGIVIYNADCREILPHIGPVDLVLTDPPYGIAHPTDYSSRGRGPLANAKDYSPIVGDSERFDPKFLLQYPCILWGSNYYAEKLPPSSGWLVWDKRVQDGKGVNDQSDCELAWANFVKGARIFRHMWNGFWKDSERGESYHPTQKPIALMRWCLSLRWTPLGTVADPYMGSGPVLLAAKQLGRRAIGIEIEEKYCEIAAKQLSQEVLPFAEPEPEPQQATFSELMGTAMRDADEWVEEQLNKEEA